MFPSNNQETGSIQKVLKNPQNLLLPMIYFPVPNSKLQAGAILLNQWLPYEKKHCLYIIPPSSAKKK